MCAQAAHDKLGVTAVWVGDTDVEEKHKVSRIDQETSSTLERNCVRGIAACQDLTVLGNRVLGQAADFEEAALVRAAVANDAGGEYAR